MRHNAGLKLAAAAAGLTLTAAYATFKIAFYSPNKTQNDDYQIPQTEQMKPFLESSVAMIRKLSTVPCETVFVESEDGLRLFGRYYHSKDGAPVVIAMHGYRGTPFRDFSGGSEFYFSSGMNLLLIEQRAHCRSEGHVISFGIKERFDCLKWIDFVRDRFGAETPVILTGISMGAATVLMASELDLPGNVKGIVADCPYTTPKAIIRKICDERYIPADLAYPFLWLGARLFGGFDLTEAGAVEAVKKAKVPILLIHGEDDNFVPCAMGREIAEANPDLIELHTFPGAGHGLSFLVDRPRYEAVVGAFINKVLSPGSCKS